jgi:hypothetical protein
MHWFQDFDPCGSTPGKERRKPRNDECDEDRQQHTIERLNMGSNHTINVDLHLLQ